MKNGWQTKKLGELCEIELGRTPARANASFWDEKRETSNVWLSIADLLQAEDRVVADSKEYVSDKGAEICKLVPKGTLLVSFKLTLGRLAFTGCNLFTNEAIAALTVLNERELSKEFLFYFLHFFDWVGTAENDVKLKGMTLNKAKLKEIQVHFPNTLVDQQRIVGVLGEAFAGIAAAKANAEKNLQNARALFESHLQSVFTQRGKGWAEIQLANVCERLHQGLNTAGEKVKFYDSGYPIIQTRNINEGVVELDSKMKFMCEEDWQLYKDKYRPEVGDVFFTNIGTIGKTAIVTTDRDYLIHWNIFKLRPCLEKITSEFLRYTLEQLTLSGYFEKLQKGGTVDFVTKKMISEASIYLPNITEQKTIVATLDSLREETRRLEHIYKRKLAALDELKKSLLHQSFNVEL